MYEFVWYLTIQSINTCSKTNRCFYGWCLQCTYLGGLFLNLGKYFSLYPEAAAAAAKLLQLCLTPCDPIDVSPLGSSVSGILQARTLEWVAISFSNAWKWKVKVKSLSRVQLLATSWSVAYQAPPSMGFSRQEYWSGLPLPSPNTSCTYLKEILKESAYIHLIVSQNVIWKSQIRSTSALVGYPWTSDRVFQIWL